MNFNEHMIQLLRARLKSVLSVAAKPMDNSRLSSFTLYSSEFYGVHTREIFPSILDNEFNQAVWCGLGQFHWVILDASLFVGQIYNQTRLKEVRRVLPLDSPTFLNSLALVVLQPSITIFFAPVTLNFTSLIGFVPFKSIRSSWG